LACALRAPAQSPVLIKLNVAATDAKGAAVTDLNAADIQVREDGKVQRTVFFRFAGNKGQIAKPAPEEFINRPSPPLTLILLDRWNEKELTLASAWQDVATAVGHQETVDRFFIYFLANRGDLVPVRALPSIETDLRAVNQPAPADLVAKLNDVVRTLTGLRDVSNTDPLVRADRTIEALGIVSRMAAIAGPKNLIWVSHGFPEQVLSLTNQWVDYTPHLLELCQLAAGAQIAIYSVDQSAEGAGADVGSVSRQTLELVAAQTGGRWYPSGRTSDAVNGSATDARGRYQLAYYAPAREGGPKQHKIRVESARKGIHLLTRQSYFGDDAAPGADQAEDAFTAQSHSPFDATDIALRVATSHKPSAIHLDIHVDAADVYLEHRGDRYRGSLSTKVALYRDGEFEDAQPAVHLDVDFTQEQYDSALKNGIVIPRDVTVKDQIQQMRVMVFDRALRGLGSVTIAVR
jgi:VWFA-related protein